MKPTQLTLYGRSYCHLCDDMRVALDQIRCYQDIVVEIVDVDRDVVMSTKYDELVPVLMGRLADGTLEELCHYFFDSVAVMAFLARQ